MKSYNGFSAQRRNEAQAWLNRQWAAGVLHRPVRCDACGQDHGVIDAHAEDYSKPFGPQTQQFGLCFICHMMVHCRFGNPQAWRRYRDAVDGGARFAPLVGRNFPRFAAQFLDAARPLPEPAVQGAPRARRVLAEIEQGIHLPADRRPGSWL